MNDTFSPTPPTRREFLKRTAGAGVILAGAGLPALAAESAPSGEGTLLGFGAPKLGVVRLGFIGVGARGSGHVGHCLKLEGVEIKAVCDHACQSISLLSARQPSTSAATKFSKSKGPSPAPR